MRGKMPKHKEIVEENLTLLEELGISPDKAINQCWACKKIFKAALIRAHVTADKYGGNQGYFLLCTDCHSAQPDGASVEYQFRWIKCYKPITSTLSQEMISEWFEQMTGVSLNHLLERLCDVYGTQGMLDRFRVALETGNANKAGPKNGIANAVYELVSLWDGL